MTAPTLRILFVCTANISRSAYAERRAADLLTEHPTIGVASAGVPGYPGRPMDEQMVAILRELGIDYEGHVSRSLTAEILAETDLVLTFEFAQRMRILDAWPDQSTKVFGFNQFADAAHQIVEAANASARGILPRGATELVTAASTVVRPDSMTSDIADPYRRGQRAARNAANQIDDALALILPLLVSAASEK